MNEIDPLKQGAIKIPTMQELEAADKNARIICLLTGETDDGGEGWAFVAIRPSLYDVFCAKCKLGEPLLPEAFGEIIAHGKGLPPPQEVVKRMQRRYGFDPHFSERLVEETKKQQMAFFVQQEALRLQAVVATLKSKDSHTRQDEQF